MRFDGILQVRARRRLKSAFTLVELLLVCAIIGILAALLLPTLGRAKLRAQRAVCISNLRQIGTSFAIFAHEPEHHGEFPVRVSTNFGGASEFVPQDVAIAEVFEVFQSISTELSTPAILRCPTDTRSSAKTFAHLDADNISYFIGTQATPNQPGVVAAGDRNVVFRPDAYSWSPELHKSKGNLLFADAHVEQANSWPFVLAASPAPPDAPSLANAESPEATPTANASPADAAPAAKSSPDRGQSQPPAPSPRASMSSEVKRFAQFDEPVISEENKPGTNSSQQSQAPFVNTPSQSESSTTALDDVPQRPPTRSFTRLMYLGVGTWLLWALIVLLLFVWKKIRERRAEHQKRTELLNENVD